MDLKAGGTLEIHMDEDVEGNITRTKSAKLHAHTQNFPALSVLEVHSKLTMELSIWRLLRFIHNTSSVSAKVHIKW